jgi:hypothetical protein
LVPADGTHPAGTKHLEIDFTQPATAIGVPTAPLNLRVVISAEVEIIPHKPEAL